VKAPYSLLIILLSIGGLQGCVAAVIPLAAAGVMSTTVRDKPDTPVVETSLTNPAPVAAQTAAEVPTPSESSAAVELLPETREALRVGGMVPGTEVIALTGTPDLPAPTSTRADPFRDATYSSFADYALGIAAMDPLTDDVRPSALLARPGILTADRAPCRFVGNAVLIDLDPADGAFNPDSPASRPQLAAALQQLREAEIEVVWSTALTADRAGDVRRWLRQNALDPTGKDRLLLLRYPEDRKQTRRQEASTERCLIAMLGDERADFDELFDYLKRPEAAVGLDTMLGKGWFLAPVSEVSPTLEVQSIEGNPE